VGITLGAGIGEELLLHGFKDGLDGSRGVLKLDLLLGDLLKHGAVAAHSDALAGLDIAGTELNTNGNTLELPLGELATGVDVVAIIDTDTNAKSRQGGLELVGSLVDRHRVLSGKVERNDHDLDGSN
jgi:hypothetical protein